MNRKVRILDRTSPYEQPFVRVDEVRLRHERFDGQMSDEIMRVSVERGDSVAALVHVTDLDVVVLCDQFRYSTMVGGSGWILEVPAGILEASETPEDAMGRELEQEIGYRAPRFESIACFYPSPGMCSERVHLFYAPVTESCRTGEGGGLAEEGEDIRVLHFPVAEALDMLRRGEIVDAKTILGLQWLEARRD